MTAVFRTSPFVIGASLFVDPDDARLMPYAVAPLRALIAAFHAVDEAGALEHRLLNEATERNPVVVVVEPWIAALNTNAECALQIAAAFELAERQAARLPSKGFASKQRLLFTGNALREALAQVYALIRAVYVHITDARHRVSGDELVEALDLIDKYGLQVKSFTAAP